MTTEPVPTGGGLDLPDLVATDNEWKAWRSVVKECAVLGIDVNDEKYNPLIKAIEAWGEQLVTLRLSQTPETRINALIEKQATYLAIASP